MYDENKSCRDLVDLNFEMFKQGQDISVPSYGEPVHESMPRKERRRSKDITSHVQAMNRKSGWTSAKGLMANATLFRYKTETFVENNPNLYNSLMFMADTYNTAALSKDIAIALGSAAVGNPAVACGFLSKYALFAGVEQLALWVCDHGAEKLALHCAEGNAALYASYLKTLDFVVDFAVKHGVCGALNKKLATANGYSSRQFNLNKPHEFRSGKTSSGVKYSERVMLPYGKGRFWEGLIKDRNSAKTCGVKSQYIDGILGKIQRAKRQIGGDIRADKNGNLYKFDNGHKTGKVHLERIEERQGKFYGTGEVNPESGAIIELIDWRSYK